MSNRISEALRDAASALESPKVAQELGVSGILDLVQTCRRIADRYEQHIENSQFFDPESRIRWKTDGGQN